MRGYYFFSKFLASYKIGIAAGLIGAAALGIGLAVACTVIS